VQGSPGGGEGERGRLLEDWEKGRRGPEIPLLPIGKRSENHQRQSAPSPQGRRPGEYPLGSRREGPGGKCARGGPRLAPAGSRALLVRSRPWSGRGGKWGGADPHHPKALTPGAGTEGPSRGKTLSPPRHEGKWSPSVQGGSCSRDWALGGRSIR
jgi:hypothetical protein